MIIFYLTQKLLSINFFYEKSKPLISKKNSWYYKGAISIEVQQNKFLLVCKCSLAASLLSCF